MKRRPRIYYSDSQKALMGERWKQGATLHEICKLFDRPHTSIHRILAETGGFRPVIGALETHSRDASLSSLYAEDGNSWTVRRCCFDQRATRLRRRPSGAWPLGRRHKLYPQIMFTSNLILRNATMQAAKWFNARKLQSSFSYRTRSLRNRLNQLCATPTTQRLAFFPGVRLSSAASWPLPMTWGM